MNVVSTAALSDVRRDLKDQFVNLGGVSRRVLKLAMEAVWRRGGQAPGPDGLTHSQVFGQGPSSPTYQATLGELGRHTHRFRLGGARPTRHVDKHNGKERIIWIANLRDRVMLRAVALMGNKVLPPSSVSTCRKGIDARWGVVRAALELRCRDEAMVMRSDLRAAFSSLRWEAVLASNVLGDSPTLQQMLSQIYRHYAPSGIGVPMGLATSSLMMDLACVRFDASLAKLGSLALRYVDDLLVVGSDHSIAEQLLDLVELELKPFGLECNSAKTVLYGRSLVPLRGGRTAQRGFPAPWLGHELSSIGEIDLAKRVASDLKDQGEETREPSRKHFELAASGQRFSKVFGDSGIRVDIWQPPNVRAKGSRRSLILRLRERIQKGGSLFSLPSHTYPSRMHPQEAPEGSHPMGLPSATEADSGGGGRGGRGLDTPCSPRPNRTDTYRQEALRGRGELLRLASVWMSNRPVDRLVAAEARILFGASASKVAQLARANDYWTLAQTALSGSGGSIAPAAEEAILGNVWSVLMTAATCTQAEAVRFCVADPLEQVMRRLQGVPAGLCRRAILMERAARAAGRFPRQLSLWGRLTTQAGHNVRPFR